LQENVPAAKRKRSNSEKSSDSVPVKKNNISAKNLESEEESNMSESTVDGPSEMKVEKDADREEKDDNEEKDDEGAKEPEANPAADEDLPFLPNARIVSELNLKNWIIYVSFARSCDWFLFVAHFRPTLLKKTPSCIKVSVGSK
jgi:hypothetical protein